MTGGEESMLERLARIAEQFDPSTPRPARLEVGAIAQVAVMAAADIPRRDPLVPANPIDILTGIAVVPKADMDPRAWRLIDQHGATMRDGYVPSPTT